MSTVIGNAGAIPPRSVSKLRWRHLPLLLPLYFVACVDRINIGFAAFSMTGVSWSRTMGKTRKT